MEAVLKVEDDEENGGKRKNKSKQKEAADDLGLSVLIDSQNNQYVLTKPRDSTIPRADHHFIKVTPPVQPLSDFACEKSDPVADHSNASLPGFSVRGDAVPALWVGVHARWSSAHVWLHRLRGLAGPLWPQHYQGKTLPRLEPLKKKNSV